MKENIDPLIYIPYNRRERAHYDNSDTFALILINNSFFMHYIDIDK